MLPRKYRLTVPQFYKLSKESKTFSSFFLKIKIKKESSFGFAVNVPKKTDKRATRRNESKRIIREAIKKKLFEITPPCCIYVQAQKIFGKKDRLTVEREFAFLLKKADLL